MKKIDKTPQSSNDFNSATQAYNPKSAQPLPDPDKIVQISTASGSNMWNCSLYALTKHGKIYVKHDNRDWELLDPPKDLAD